MLTTELVQLFQVEVLTVVSMTELLLNTQWSCRGSQDYISHPVLYQEDQEASSRVLRTAFQLFSRSWLGGTSSLSCCHLIYLTGSTCLSSIIILFFVLENLEFLIIKYISVVILLGINRKITYAVEVSA